MRNIRDYIDLIESIDTHGETRLSVRIDDYETDPTQAVDSSSVSRTFIITFDEKIPDDQIEQRVRDEVLSITGFKPARLAWKLIG